jgi:hypothetical protein
MEDDGIWRTALAGPTRYVWKLLKDEQNFRIDGVRPKSAPKLSPAEMTDARRFATYILEMKKEGKTVLDEDFLYEKYDQGPQMRAKFKKIDEGYFKWREKNKDVELTPLTDLFAFVSV